MQKSSKSTQKASTENANAQLITEVTAMAEFAMTRGQKIDPGVLVLLDEIQDAPPTAFQIKRLTNYHNSLVNQIRPALPKNVVYLKECEDTYKNRKYFFHSKFPMLRKMLVFSVMSVIVLLVCSLSSDVSAEDLSKGILHSSGWVVLTNFIFLSSAAAIGASFLVLSNIRSKFSDGTYHPDQNSSLWTTIILGIVGGIIMSEIVSIDPSSGNVDMNYVNNKMMLALLGGFSSKLVYDALNKLIATVGSMITTGGDTGTSSADYDKVINEADMQVSRIQLNIAGQLSALRGKLDTSGDPKVIKKDLESLINSIHEDLGITTKHAGSEAE